MANWSWPVTGHITQTFGKQSDGTIHPGLDIGVPTGTSVLAAASGKIIKAGWWGKGGNTIQIDNGDGTTSQYMHLSKFTQPIGAQVAPGQQIGLSGASGVVTGPHLHFEVNRNGVPVDPLPYLTGTPTSSISNASPSDIAASNALAKANPSLWKSIANVITFGVLGNAIKDSAPVKNTLSAAETTAKIGGFVTNPTNWKRIGIGTLGAVILLIAALELTSKSGAVATIAKVVP